MEQEQISSPGEGARDDAQLFLGQLHGVLYRIVVVDGVRVYGYSEDGSGEDWERLVAAYHECEGFGKAQDALNAGKEDEKLVDEALAGKQGEFKFKGWRSRLRAFYGHHPSLPMARRVLGWASGLLESLSGVPGVSQIKEIVGLVERLLSEKAEQDAALVSRKPSAGGTQ
jgi:hypothetical protein